jgi:hypothetical protein
MKYRSSHYELSQLDSGPHRLTRTAEPFETLTDLVREHEALIPHLEPCRAQPLLVDLREAKGRNDASFEASMARFRQAMFRGFPKIVVLVRSAIGKLQVQRHFVEDGLASFVVTTSELEASRELVD